ncbi:hypothetical protein LOTGIDRAFT_159051 [Lottia gigantea]|uniref:CUB domain-containing protein n=1 Tax=Lottia gigantea TaxID=225164 RepID=V4AXF4_LOTGI|nr:hypothetical protein LOTGIDRAFT_159051 [Lottia gigantea]ESO98256.1 hypothetical protein LOTGIDRAFT_159051 [Lottia gigantea]
MTIDMLPGRACNKLYSDLDGAVIEGNGDIYYFDPCQIQIQCRPYEKWMFHVEQISLLTCNVYIEMFYSDFNHQTSSPSFTFRCAEPNPGIVYTNSSYITLKLHHNNETDFRFRIVFTCRKFESPCESFLCDNGNCISPDLNCDDVDNCFDFTEEWENGTAACIEYYPFPGENFGVLISVVCVGGFVGLSAACCRMWRRRKQEMHDEDLYEIKSGPYVHKYAYRYAFLKPPSHFRRDIKKSDRFAR